MIEPTKRNGMLGELAAARYLRDRGYEILDANFSCRLGEVDIIARKKATVVFCEVKTRTAGSLALPREAVDLYKQKRIVAAAMSFMKRRGLTEGMRFDVAEVILDPDDTPHITWIENAFTGDHTGNFGI